MYLKLEGHAVALTPIVHGGDKSGGTLTELRRERIRVGDAFIAVPVISANAIAGILRDCCAHWCLDQAGVTTLDNLRAVDLLSSGGMLTKVKSDSSYINLADERRWRELFPVIGLFGASIGNRVLGGRIDVHRWLPLCQELVPYLPPDLAPLARQFQLAELLQELEFTRNDDKKNRYWQDRIVPDLLARYQDEKEARELADEPGASTSMRYGFEAFAAGTMFSVCFLLRNPTRLELGAFFGALSYFQSRPVIGGRGSRGFGQVQLHLKQYRLSFPASVEEPLAVETMAETSAFLREHKDDIVKTLERL